MAKLLTALTILILAGCSTPLRPDPSPAAADVGYPTAEFRAQGRLFHGLGEVLVTRGSPLSAARLEVQGYHEGVIRVDSAACGVGQSWSYVDNETKLVDLPGLATESCLVDIVVSPSFGDAAGGTRVYELKGQLLVKVLDAGQPWEGFSSKIRAGADLRLSVPVAPPLPASPVRLFFRGCESSYDRTGQPVNRVMTLLASELSGPIQERRCLYEGAAQQDGYAKRLSWRIWGYSPSFTPLPLPVIEPCRGRLCVTADDSVSILALDDDYVFDSESRFRFDPAAAHVLRAFTVKGRSFLCEYEPTGGTWTCLN